MLPSFLVIDNFLTNPQGFRRKALALNYDPKNKVGQYPGLISTKPLAIDGLDKRVSELIGTPVKPAPETSHNHCRLTLKGETGRSGVHVDPCFYSGILYLSQAEHCRGGTDFYKHRRTGLEHIPKTEIEMVNSGYRNTNTLIDDVINKDTNLASKWERTMRVSMRFNRLLLLSPLMFHNAAPGFGKNLDNGRLVHLMFFVKA